MTKDTFKILKTIAKAGKKTRFSILSYIGDRNNVVMATNMETQFSAPCEGIADGVYSIEAIERYVKTGIVPKPSLDLSDWPELRKAPVKGWANSSNIPFKETIPFLSTNYSQYTLQGALLNTEKGELCGINERILYLKKFTWAGTQKFSVIIPQLWLQLSEDVTEICYSEGNLFGKIGNALLSTSILDGKFPNYNMFIPKKNANVIPNFPIKHAVKIGLENSMLHVAEDKHNNVHKVHIAFNNKVYQYYGADEDTCGYSIPHTDNIDSQGITLSAELLERIHDVLGDRVTLNFNSEFSPVMITGNDPTITCVIMPRKDVPREFRPEAK